MKGITGIKGFKDKVISEKIKYTKSTYLSLPDGIKHGNFLPSTLLTVGKYGGEQFDTISDSLSSIKDSASDKWYCIILSGGEYNENITLPPYVVLVGNHTAQIVGTIEVTGSTILDSITATSATTVISIPTDSNLQLWNCIITGDIDVVDSTIICRSLSVVGDFSFQGDSTLQIWNSGLISTLTKVDAGLWSVLVMQSRLSEYFYAENATSQLTIENAILRRYTAGSIIILEAGIANSYVRMRHSTLQAAAGSDTIDVSGGAGNLEVWTGLNCLSRGFGAQVNENIATSQNIIDTGFEP